MDISSTLEFPTCGKCCVDQSNGSGLVMALDNLSLKSIRSNVASVSSTIISVSNVYQCRRVI